VRHYFLDASAVVKLHAVEPGSTRVKAMVRSATSEPATARIVLADLSHPEAVSGITSIAFGGKAGPKGLSPAAAKRARADLAETFGPTTVFTVVSPAGLMSRAAELVWRHRIKASDAVQLATALYARNALPGWSEFYFVGSDARQNAASRAEGLDVIDPAA
jgi:predicted nucleic acid-binding protein